jgi:hypothetical protein
MVKLGADTQTRQIPIPGNYHSFFAYCILCMDIPIDFIEQLLINGADPNGANENGNTPLELAVGNVGFLPIASLLLQYGADPLTPYKYKDKNGYVKGTLLYHIILDYQHQHDSLLLDIKHLCFLICQKYGVTALKKCIDIPVEIKNYNNNKVIFRTMSEYYKKACRAKESDRPNSVREAWQFILKISIILSDERFKLHQLVLYNNIDMLKEELEKIGSLENIIKALFAPTSQHNQLKIFDGKQYSAIKFAKEIGFEEIAKFLQSYYDAYKFKESALKRVIDSGLSGIMVNIEDKKALNKHNIPTVLTSYVIDSYEIQNGDVLPIIELVASASSIPCQPASNNVPPLDNQSHQPPVRSASALASNTVPQQPIDNNASSLNNIAVAMPQVHAQSTLTKDTALSITI